MKTRSCAQALVSTKMVYVLAALIVLAVYFNRPPQVPAQRRNLEQNPHPNNETSSNTPTLDFYVAGFPKCGTTTLLKTFEAHDETTMPAKEECAVDVRFKEDVAQERMAKALNVSNVKKRGIKCPSGLSKRESIERLASWYPTTKLIVGLRHPVYYFQSFYNYRVNTVNMGKMKGPIPSPETLIGSKEWALVSTESARFEQTLKKLGKTESDGFEPTPFKLFLYTLEQMEDENEGRTAAWRESLRAFLELKKPIQPLKRANQNHKVRQNSFPETIDICEEKYSPIRNELVENGKETQRWIRQEFLQSPDLTVANAAHFDEILKSWGKDPCAKAVH